MEFFQSPSLEIGVRARGKLQNFLKDADRFDLSLDLSFDLSFDFSLDLSFCDSFIVRGVEFPLVVPDGLFAGVVHGFILRHFVNPGQGR